ncbi:hypothetical protein KAFR_0B05120 [Kazachstania africana CBS 2517]|uniref:DNA repair metallo-beta-lactamase domain-containing protein n=1 Tax=Kazachstania africana (strain ATCC 22294 / BCRC 22015 / CBS 2517 / CECT 1963 / NBRC 1671 / NRRL Y-8276) TaxID=1071382 RepID=H2AR08_KAZAF|nr:hypothetical protein KAFR_0B05120 [Kazachstania africana CBS 2517]CCF56808.1 hypothetical protein KAFR_0B05120 [Kazachstania africana CBS 2517]
MPRKSIVELKSRDIRLKDTKRKIGKSKQRRLFEYDIPTTSNLKIQERNGFKLKVNSEEDPIILQEEKNEDSDGECAHPMSGKFQSIFCPICNLDISKLELFERETHCENCLESNEASTNVSKHYIEERRYTAVDEITFPSSIESIKSDGVHETVILNEEDLLVTLSDDNEEGLPFHLADDMEKIPTGPFLEQEDDPIIIDIASEEEEVKKTIKHTIKGNHTKIRKTFTEKLVKKRSSHFTVNKSSKRSTRKQAPLPSVKILSFINGFKVVVDGFNYEANSQINDYFLSHFHSDHYIGLKKSWDKADKIYCSPITSKLLQFKFKISADRIVSIPNREKHWITSNISVTPFDANHCPGAQVFLFQEWATKDSLKPMKQILHTGDFRSNSHLINEIHDFLKVSRNLTIDEVYLDTTYLSQNNNFPSQSEIVTKTTSYVIDFLQKRNKRHNILLGKPKKKIILVGSYSIGKEKLAISISRNLKCKMVVYNSELRSVYINDLLKDMKENSDSETEVHLVPIRMIKDEDSILKYLKDIIQLKWIEVELIGLIPTGWTMANSWWGMKYHKLPLENKFKISSNIEELSLDDDWYKKQVDTYKKFQIFNVPYSEHSSFTELVNFGTTDKFKWGKIIPTVNLHSLERITDMDEWFKVWKKINTDRTKGIYDCL